MEPRIQYAKTEDGVNIAYWTLGEGVSLVALWLSPFSHVQLEWHVPEFRGWYERLAEGHRLVRYDPRGTGLSDRGVADLSFDAHLLDLQAVVESVGLERFALFAAGPGGPVAIAYAARYPERISHLVLWCSYARGSDMWGSSRGKAMRTLFESDWELFTETFARVFGGWSEGERARQYAASIREWVTQEECRTYIDAQDEVDVTELLGDVKAPTLVLHRRGLTMPGMEAARHLAARIPGARLTLLEGTAQSPWEADTEAIALAFDEFLGEGEGNGVSVAAASGLVTILFTDVEASTALTDRLGDAKARDVMRTHERIVRDALRSHGGSEVKTMGDGFMASFSSATKALECAIAMQRAFEEHNESAEEPIRVRVGLNAGEPIAEEEDLFGTAVIVAARIAAKAEGGEIIASDVVRQLVAGKGFLFADRGDTALRGFEDPVRLFEVRWREEGSP
jgi:class 3 adenylate cyclase